MLGLSICRKFSRKGTIHPCGERLDQRPGQMASPCLTFPIVALPSVPTKDTMDNFDRMKKARFDCRQLNDSQQI